MMIEESKAYLKGKELEEKISEKYSHCRKYINDYHKLYERNKIWSKNTWMGVPCWKLPMDAFVVQELIVKTRPEFIIETGTGFGGSAMFYASVCEMIGEGRVISIDIEDRRTGNEQWENRSKFQLEDRLKFIVGDSVSHLVSHEVKETVGNTSNCMVILDSWHTREHVYQEMLIYSPLVKQGGYMIVEDSHAAGNPVPWKYDDDGPMGSIMQWIHSYGDQWEIDKECEKHLLTFNPNGFLRRK